MDRHFGSPDAAKILLLLGLAAMALLGPLRAVCEALPPLAFAATLTLFLMPGTLVTRWFFGTASTGRPSCRSRSLSVRASSPA